MKQKLIVIEEDLQGYETAHSETIFDPSITQNGQKKYGTSGYLKGSFSSGEYEGWVKNGKLNGLGILRSWDFEHWGEFINNEATGFGIHKGFSSSIIEGKFIPFKYYGEFKNGRILGNGAMLFLNGIQYFGEFSDSLFTGLGVLNNPDGRYYAGEFKSNKFHGYGMMQLDEEYFYIGKFEFDRPQGLGLISNGKSTYVVSDFYSQSSLKLLYSKSEISNNNSMQLCKHLFNKKWSVSDCFIQKLNNNKHLYSVKSNISTFFNSIQFTKFFDIYQYPKIEVNFDFNSNLFNNFTQNILYIGDLFLEQNYTEENWDESDKINSFRDGVSLGEYNSGHFNGIALINSRTFFDIGQFKDDLLCGTGIKLDIHESYCLGDFNNNSLISGLTLDLDDQLSFYIRNDSNFSKTCFSVNKSAPFEWVLYNYEKETGELLYKKDFDLRKLNLA